MDNVEQIIEIREMVSRLETKSAEHERRIALVEEYRDSINELTYNVKTLNNTMQGFQASMSNCLETIKELERTTAKIQNAPKDILWDLTSETVVSFVKKVFPFIIILIGVLAIFL